MSLEDLARRIDRRFDRLETKLAAYEQKTAERLAAQEARLTKLEINIDQLMTKIDGIRRGIDRLEGFSAERYDALSLRISRLKEDAGRA